ncbi:unnamed protein product [Paramecium sonneborni]|uniref:PAS domain-containing protein n=1 Tax=Paramecium sonneborni TaxID=65129 RepID=A0A8S1N6E2_9CILI|nr:unnamed protein product [Paramecium sonneborni]
MNKIIVQMKSYYIQEFLNVKETWRKSFKIAVVILLIENIQMLSIYTEKLNDFEYDQFLNHIRNFIDYFRSKFLYIYQILHIVWKFNQHKNNIHNSRTFIVKLSHFIAGQLDFQNESVIDKKLRPLIFGNRKIEKNQLINLILSLFFQIHHGILQIPQLFCGFSLITDLFNFCINKKYSESINYFEWAGVILGIMTIVQQIIIGSLINLHQFDHRMKNFDYLGKFQQQKIHLIYAFQLLVIISSGIQASVLIVQLLGVIKSVIQIICDYNQEVFIDYRISRLNLRIVVLCTIYQILLMICQFGQPTLKISIVLLILLFYPPLIFLTNEILIRQDIKNTNYQTRNLEKYIRRLYIMFKQQVDLKKQQRLLDPQQSLEIYTFISSHLRECKIQRERKMMKNIKLKYKCFCQDFFTDQDSFQSLESMKQFAKGLIGQTFEDEIIEKANTNLILIYIYFLVQIKKVPTQAIYEVIRLSMIEKDQPLKNQAIVNKLKHDALQKFSDIVKKNDLVNQRFVFKKVYQYEESLSVLKTNLCIVVKQEKDFYGCILTQIIDIDMLLNVGFKLIQNIRMLENQFQLLFKTNPQNNECDTIFNIFHKYVNYNKIRPKLYRKEGQIMMQFLQSAEKIIYDPGSCVIQITLLQPRGNVIRYTRSFQRAIGYKDEEIQDQNINRFMPQIIANDHDLYLDNFVERGRINVVRSAVRVILGKTKSQFVVPINTRLRIEASPIEFGATALITPVNLTYGYMMLNESGQIEELTQNLYEDVFEKHLGLELDHVKGLDCLFFIPELGKIWDNLFDDHFEKLDKKFDCQLILPLITKQMSRSLIRSRSNIFSKTNIQTNIAKQFENLPHENVVYQISIHLMSLITINLKLVIVEIPEYKQLMNQKITSRQLLQLRNRSSQLINISSSKDLPTQKVDLALSSLNSPPGGITYECDLEYENLIEDIKMIEELKNQLATINMNNTAQNNQNDPFLLQNSDNQLEGRIIEFRNDPSEQSNEFSEADSDFKENAQDQNIQYNNGSVGSRSSQNNTTALKRQIKDCLSDSKGLGIRTKLFLALIYFLITSGFLINYLILYFNFQKIHENQKYENLPFEFSYYYNEFIIGQSYLDYDQFNFTQLSQISFQYFMINIKNIDKTISLLPHVNIINNLTMETRILNIMSQLTKVLNMNHSINQNEFYNNTDSFNLQIGEIENANSTKQLLSLSIFVTVEEIILFILLGQYIYFCVQIIKMKQKIYKLFCTFSKEVIQEQFVQFSSLYTQLNNTRFRNHETDEEQFETTMMRQYQKTVSSNMLDKHNRVGKQISQKQTNTAQIFFFLFIFMYAFICSCYFIGSFILQQVTQQNVSSRYQEKTSFSITFNSLASTFAQQTILLNTTITSDMTDYYNVAVQQLGLLTTNLTLYQEDQNYQVYQILVQNLCSLFLSELSYSYQEYQDLFTLQQCQSMQILDQGLSSVVQHLFSNQFDFFQVTSTSSHNTIIKEQYQDPTIQLLRLYAQYGFQVIIELLTNQIISMIDSTFLVNTIMFIFACVIMSVSLIATKITIEKVKQQYQQSKQLLTLFPFDRLMENAYVISFITHDLRFSV